MSRFDHVLVMITIVLGLGVTQLLGDFGSLLEQHSNPTFYGPHAVWCVVTFALQTHFWWAMWLYREDADDNWTYLEYVLILLGRTFLYFMGELVLPGNFENLLTMKEHYNTIAKWYFLSLSAYLVVAIMIRKRVLKIELWHRSNIVRYMGLCTAVLAAVTATLKVHESSIDGLFAGLGGLLLIVFIYCFNPWSLAEEKPGKRS